MFKVLVTGANGGFGNPTIMKLLKCGHEVVASMREIRGRNRKSADELGSLGAKIIEMDITKDRSVETGVAKALEAIGGVDVVVNNAGIGVLGVQETFTSDDWLQIFDVNVFGIQRVIRAILPHMREKRSGLLVQISSLLGRIALPFYGPYNASKWALEAMSENYRVELSAFGVDVAIIEPGGHPTTFFNDLMLPSDKSRDSSLGTMPRDAQSFLSRFEQSLAANPAQNPQNVADAIVKVIETPVGQRPFRTVIDTMGMGGAIQPYNEQLEKLTSDIYSAFEISHMRQIETHILPDKSLQPMPGSAKSG